MRLIDADALRMTCRLISLSPNDARVLQYAIQTMIDTAPTIDAEPVRHGHWVEKDKYSFGVYRACSMCDELILDTGHSWNYCPNCGAKMDE